MISCGNCIIESAITLGGARDMRKCGAASAAAMSCKPGEPIAIAIDMADALATADLVAMADVGMMDALIAAPAMAMGAIPDGMATGGRRPVGMCIEGTMGGVMPCRPIPDWSVPMPDPTIADGFMPVNRSPCEG